MSEDASGSRSAVGNRGPTLFGAAAVCALLVVPVALAGEEGGRASSSASGSPKVVKKLKRQVAALSARVAALEGKPGGQTPSSLPPSGPAGGDLTGSYPAPLIATDAVGPLEVQNPTRSVTLPLLSFFNDFDNEPLDFTASDGTSPDLGELLGDFGIIWDSDVGGGAPDADTDAVATTLVVPPDYVSGGSLALHTQKASNAGGVAEQIRCGTTPNGGGSVGGDGPVITTDLFTLHTFNVNIGGGLTPGSSLEVFCRVTDSVFPGGATADDAVAFHSIEFRYTAAQ